MRYSRLLASLILAFVVVGAGAQLLRHWLNDVERGRQYGAGDALGCWFSGRWHTAAGDRYVASVNDHLSRRISETADFQER